MTEQANNNTFMENKIADFMEKYKDNIFYYYRGFNANYDKALITIDENMHIQKIDGWKKAIVFLNMGNNIKLFFNPDKVFYGDPCIDNICLSMIKWAINPDTEEKIKAIGITNTARSITLVGHQAMLMITKAQNRNSAIYDTSILD